jgi:murein DD-endopeptidase MepM/ murein hydrolase activator NlpD
MVSSPVPSSLCNPLMHMEIRFDGPAAPGGLRTVNGARFGMVRNRGQRPHQGVDLFAPVGTTVYAVANGEIVRIRHHDPSYGKEVMLRFHPTRELLSRLSLSTNDVLYILYAHLSHIYLTLGQVNKGQPIGLTGVSGNADQRYPHLHLEVRTIKDAGLGLQHRLDPEILFSGIDYSKPVETLDRINRTV